MHLAAPFQPRAPMPARVPAGYRRSLATHTNAAGRRHVENCSVRTPQLSVRLPCPSELA